MSELTGGQALMRQLAREGPSHIFCVPGVQLDWAVDALFDVAERIQLCVPRHEQATSYMADGFARTTGRPGICMVVPGPGVLNAMSGLATAYACSSPVVCLAGQIVSQCIGQGYGLLHEVRDQSKTLATVTKWSALATAPGEIPQLVREAFGSARAARMRPVAIEVPPDVLQARGEIDLLDPLPALEPSLPEEASLEAAAALLGQARFPVIFAGGGVLASGATEALKKLANRLGAPVVMSENGGGAISDRHPLAMRALGGRALLPHADVVLVVGSRFVTLRGYVVLEASHARFIYLNTDRADTTPPREPGVVLEGDARVGLEWLDAALSTSVETAAGVVACTRVRAWCDQQLASLEPQLSWLQALRRALPDDGIFINELTQIGYVAPLAFPVFEPRTFITPGYQGTLGYGYPTGLGAAIGNPDRIVVAVSGDGGFGWNLQELATAARYDIPLIAVIFNDGAFGNVRRIQKEVFGREIGAALHNPDFVRLAEAFGVPAVRIHTPAALEGTIREAAVSHARGPLLIEARVEEMPSPWHLINRFSQPPQPAPPNPLGEPVLGSPGRHQPFP